MAASSEFARRQAFSGDPMKKARDWIKKEDWENVSWAFDEMSSRKSYFANKTSEDVEDFVLEVVKLVFKSPKNLALNAARTAFAEVNFRSDFVTNLLKRHESPEPSPKKPKSAKSSDIFFEAFHTESDEDYQRRLGFVVEMLTNSKSVAVDSAVFSLLFDLIKESLASFFNFGEVVSSLSTQFYSFVKFNEKDESLTMRIVNLLLKLIKSPGGKYKITSADLKMDYVIEMMRNTHSHHILRECLRLLTAAVRISPTSVTSHMMSVFTFMGNGLLRKDNELTLRIIEDTLEALFLAVCEEDGKVASSNNLADANETSAY
ncbi:unnamed protein product [Cylicostephanus goldi]|uniref:HEAT repeat-containing protein 1 n=1 Tax=Cylicostephanus goldi TaxID=71465 RepID=A0A3P6QSR8_CYLGO|nr:unnamed protein product [Cylicostephanus goldi]